MRNCEQQMAPTTALWVGLQLEGVARSPGHPQPQECTLGNENRVRWAAFSSSRSSRPLFVSGSSITAIRGRRLAAGYLGAYSVAVWPGCLAAVPGHSGRKCRSK